MRRREGSRLYSVLEYKIGQSLHYQHPIGEQGVEVVAAALFRRDNDPGAEHPGEEYG